jgi:hypothetical protein
MARPDLPKTRGSLDRDAARIGLYLWYVPAAEHAGAKPDFCFHITCRRLTAGGSAATAAKPTASAAAAGSAAAYLRARSSSPCSATHWRQLAGSSRRPRRRVIIRSAESARVRTTRWSSARHPIRAWTTRIPRGASHRHTTVAALLLFRKSGDLKSRTTSVAL